MPGLIGYMLAIVVTLGGYFAALNWLIRPPDPWQSSASTAQHLAVRKRPPPVVKPAEPASSDSTVQAEPDARLASVEASAPPAASENETAASENETARRVEPTTVQAQLPEATRPAVEVARHDVPATKTRSGNRKRVERNTSRKLELMVLRTYERSDGKRFTRLLPMSSARNAMAFQPDDPW